VKARRYVQIPTLDQDMKKPKKKQIPRANPALGMTSKQIPALDQNTKNKKEPG